MNALAGAQSPGDMSGIRMLEDSRLGTVGRMALELHPPLANK
jgi:hypothetical protein